MFRIILLIVLIAAATPAHGDQFDHRQWDQLLKQHVRVLPGGVATRVDYQGMSQDRATLGRYLDRLAAFDPGEFDAWSDDQQLAFLINAYNSWTVELILTRYPDLDSIKELGSLFQSPWQKRFIPLLGKERSLDEIEHQLIRGSGRYNDPRIHFAVNCASIGCPALRAEAYRGGELQTQLAEATALFLKDRSRNRLAGQELQVSSIFKWYGEDFRKGWRKIFSLRDFLASHAQDLGLTRQQSQQLLDGKIKVRFLKYDWKLNRTPERVSGGRATTKK
jgi:hypothetical protein